MIMYMRGTTIVTLMLITVTALRAQEKGCFSFLKCKQSSFDLVLRGGVQPLLWGKRGGIFGENAVITGAPAQVLFSFGQEVGADPTTIIQGQCIPPFTKFFKTPWMVGAQCGYSWSTCWRLFIEGNYAQAAAKNSCDTQLPVFASTGAPAGTTLNFTMHAYRFVDAYLGANYYMTACKRVELYLSAKIGLIHHLQSNFSLTQTLPLPDGTRILDLVPSCPKRPFIERSTSCAGGVGLGVDICLCKNLSLLLMAEVVANRGPKTNCNIPVSLPQIPTRRVFFGPIKSEVRFPITAGLMYAF